MSIFFSYFSQLLLLSSFFNRGNSCEIESSKYFDAMFEMIYFLNMFLYCKIVISFLELFPVTCFLCILQVQFTRRNTLIPTKFKQCQHMTFMMTSFNDDKSDICQFFIKTYSILSIQYKISCKMDKNFLIYMCFHPPPPSLQFFWEI